ncbi:MAG: serine kinase [Myxococcaceae bacterium]|nr:serine kinase [Myxococcaceae bacterium]
MASFTLLSPSDGARVALAHGLGSCFGVVPVPAGTVNSNYFLETERGRVFVRLYEQQEVDGVSYEWTLLDHLTSRGVPVPARVRGPAPGELRVGGKPVAVFRVVPGHDLCQALVTRERLYEVGVALARASRAGEDFPIRREGRFTFGDLVRLLDKAREAGRPELESDLARLYGLHAELTAAQPVLPRGVVHGDLFRDNVLWQGEQLAALLDWESASDGIVIYDLAVTLLAWCCGDTLSFELARALVQGYQSERAIAETEWQGLHWALRVACLRFASSRLIDVYLKGSYPAGYKSYARFLTRLDAVEAHSPSSLAALLR